MGTNCASLIADLFLYCYESQFMAKVQKDPSKHSLISLFNNNCIYSDNILTANYSNFLKFVKQIYPKELTLSTANIASDPCQFLDLDISFSEGKLNTHVYDKRRLYIPYLKLVEFYVQKTTWLNL